MAGLGDDGRVEALGEHPSVLVHDGLWPPRGPAGVEEELDGVGHQLGWRGVDGPARLQGGVIRGPERAPPDLDDRVERLHDVGEGLSLVAVDDGGPAPGVVQHVRRLACGQPHVHGHEHEAGLGQAEDELGPLQRVAGEDGDVVAGPQPSAQEVGSNAVGPLVERGPRELGVAEHHRRLGAEAF